MKKMILAVTTAVGLMASVPAAAGTYTVSYTSNFDAGGTANFSGVFTTTDTANARGFFTVTSLAGTRDGLAATLLAPGSLGGNDNLFKPTTNYVTQNGITYSAGGVTYNLFANSSVFLRELNVGAVTNFSVSQVPAAVQSPVPEPAAWAMMMGGFGVVGGTMRRRQKVKPTVRFA